MKLVKRRRTLWRKWTAVVAAVLLVVAALYEMPAMAHRGLSGHGADYSTAAAPPHDARASSTHHDHDAGLHANVYAAGLKSGQAAISDTSADQSPCASCPLCLALIAEPPMADAPDRASHPGHTRPTPFDRSPDPAVPPPRLFA